MMPFAPAMLQPAAEPDILLPAVRLRIRRGIMGRTAAGMADGCTPLRSHRVPTVGSRFGRDR